MHPKYWKPHRNHFLRSAATGEGEAGGASSTLVDSFSSFFDEAEPSKEESASQPEAQATETPEAAAERIAAEEAAAANQEPAADGEQQEGKAYDPAETVTVEIDGKMVELTKAQIAEAKKGELRQKDYTQKTMAAAEETRAAREAQQKAHAERENYAQQLNNFALTSEAILAQQQSALTEELLRSDPVEYMALERTFRERQANLAKAQQELQRINGERQQEQAQQEATYKQEQVAKLLDALPEWKDQAKAKAEGEKIAQYLQSEGWSAQEVAALSDHRHVLAARKAMLYDALMTRAKEAAGKVAKAPPKVERPGTVQVAPTDGRTKLMKELKATGSKNVAAQLFESFV